MIEDGKLSYEELTSIYLFRIQEHDRKWNNIKFCYRDKSNAIEEARKLDQERGRNKSRIYMVFLSL